jgi:hypothetical protein
VNRHVNDPEAQLITSSALGSNRCVTVLPPVEINHTPIDSTEITRCIGVVIEDLNLESEDEHILPFICQKKEQQKAAHGIR